MKTACIEWAGRKDKDGYGRRSAGKLAHRFAYEAARGPIPEGMTVDHLCFNPPCVNPQHLRLLTPSENSSNKRPSSVTHCVNGHEFTPENTYIRPVRYRGGKRDCRTCIRDRAARYKAKRRAA